MCIVALCGAYMRFCVRPGQAVVTLLGEINSFISEVCSEHGIYKYECDFCKKPKTTSRKDDCRYSQTFAFQKEAMEQILADCWAGYLSPVTDEYLLAKRHSRYSKVKKILEKEITQKPHPQAVCWP